MRSGWLLSERVRSLGQRQVRTLPEQAQALPEQAQALLERAQVLPEQAQALPEQAQALPCCPEPPQVRTGSPQACPALLL